MITWPGSVPQMPQDGFREDKLAREWLPSFLTRTPRNMKSLVSESGELAKLGPAVRPT
jgi:hypothetical protein